MNYEIEQNPDYVRDIRKLENSDPASADTTFNPLFLRILNNIEAVRLRSEANSELLGNGLSNLISDIATLTFKLALKGYIDTDGMKQVVVDRIEAEDDIHLISGFFDPTHKKVYI